MSHPGQLAEACTGPRVSLLAVLALASLVALLQFADDPLSSALQAAVAAQKAPGAPALSGPCAAAGLNDQAGPLRSFDGRQGGYTSAEALTVLCAMDADGGGGRNAYLDRHFPLDMLFAPLYGAALAALLLFLLRRYSLHTGYARFLVILPIAGALLDIAENLVVRRLVAAPLPPDARLVELASGLTVVKYALVNASVVGIFLFLLWYLVTESLPARR